MNKLFPVRRALRFLYFFTRLMYRNGPTCRDPSRVFTVSLRNWSASLAFIKLVVLSLITNDFAVFLPFSQFSRSVGRSANHLRCSGRFENVPKVCATFGSSKTTTRVHVIVRRFTTRFLCFYNRKYRVMLASV